MEALKNFFNTLLETVGQVLPGLFGTIVIFILGWFIAKFIRDLTGKLLKKLQVDEKLKKKLGESPNIESFISNLVYFVIMLFVLTVTLERLGMTQVLDPIKSMINDFLGAIPNLVKAGIIGFIGYFIAQIASSAVSALTSPIDKHAVKIGLSEETKISSLLGQIVFIFIAIPVFISALKELAITAISDPATKMLETIIGAVPHILTAAVIAIVGFIIAKIISTIISNLCAPADSCSEKLGLGKDFKTSTLIGKVAFVLILVPVLISALDALKIKAISVPATEMLHNLMNSLPKILAAGIILAVAFIVGRFVTNLLTDLLKSSGFDKIGTSLGLGEDTSISSFIGKLAFTFILLFATIEASGKLEMPQIAALLYLLVHFAGKVAFGLAIVIGGHFISQKIFAILTQGKEATITAQIARGAVFTLVLAMGLKSMGIADDIINLAFGLTLGAIAVAFALSFGLGGREAAGKQMEHFLKKFRKED